MEQIYCWHRERALFYARTQSRPMPLSIGARLGESQALWVPDFKSNVLRVIDATGRPDDSLDPLLNALAREAAELGFRHVELWDDAVSLRLTGGEPLPRTDDVPMGQAFTPRGALFMGPLSRACWA
jgi:hypothetical protein